MGGPTVRLSTHRIGGFSARRQYHGRVIGPGIGIPTGAARTSPATRSGWSRARARASAPAQEWPRTMAGPTPIAARASAISVAWACGAASAPPWGRSLQPKPGRSKAMTRNPRAASRYPTPPIGSAALAEAPCSSTTGLPSAGPAWIVASRPPGTSTNGPAGG